MGSNTEAESMQLLGVRIDTLSMEQTGQRARDFLHSKKQHMIFTPNPEMLVSAHRNAYFKTVLNEADVNVCDGRGIELLSKEKITRLPGIDVMKVLCGLAQESEKSVYLLGSGDSTTIAAAAEQIRTEFPALRIVGYDKGMNIIKKSECETISYDDDDNERMITDIIMAAPDILFVGFGHEKQELWIYEQLPNLPSVRIAMGVGGSFDILAGKLKRAPVVLQRIGLEWLWRLILQPRRLKRIWNAVIVFPFLCVTK